MHEPRNLRYKADLGTAVVVASLLVFPLLLTSAGIEAVAGTRSFSVTPEQESSLSTLEKAKKRLALFDYTSSAVLSVERTLEKKSQKYSRETIRLTIDDPLGQRGEFVQDIRFFRKSGEAALPLVLVFPPFTGTQYLDTWSSGVFVQHGYHAAVIVPSESIMDLSRSLDHFDDLLIREVIVTRMCLDVLEALPEVDGDRIYAYGISLGGIRASLAFGVEPRIKKMAEVVGGGDIPGIIKDTLFSRLVKIRENRMRLENLATPEEVEKYLEAEMHMDPLDFAILREPEDVIMVISDHDRFVPTTYQEKLRTAFSRPETGSYPSVIRSKRGHVLTALHYKKYIEKFVEFFEE